MIVQEALLSGGFGAEIAARAAPRPQPACVGGLNALQASTP